MDPKEKLYKPLYQPSGRQLKRLKKKCMGKDNWYMGSSSKEDDSGTGTYSDKNVRKQKQKSSQKVGNNKVVASSIMFLPNTKGGILLRRMRENEEKLASLTGFKIRYSEAGGMKLGMLFSTNLSSGQPCGREKCQPCMMSSEGKAQDCRATGILYESSCCLCNPKTEMQGNTSSPEEDHQQGLQAGKKYVADPSHKGRVGIYIGETSRSLSERAGEHYRDARDFSKKSHIIKHWMNNHQDEDKIPPFIIKITKKYRDCLSRQVGEAIAIHMSGDELLNSKNEYASNCISRVGVEETTFERKQREWEEETDEKKEEERLDAFRKAKEGKSNHKDYGRGDQRATDPDGEEEIPRNN